MIEFFNRNLVRPARSILPLRPITVPRLPLFFLLAVAIALAMLVFSVIVRQPATCSRSATRSSFSFLRRTKACCVSR